MLIVVAGGPDIILIERDGYGVLTGHVTSGQVIVLYVRDPIRRTLYESGRRLPVVDFAAIREEIERFKLQCWFKERRTWPALEPEPPPAGAMLGRLSPPRLLARARGRRPSRSRPGMRRARDLARMAA